MNIRSQFLAGLVLALLPTLAHAAPPAVTVVRQFMNDRSTGHISQAYALLSVDSQRLLSAKDFVAGIPAADLNPASKNAPSQVMMTLARFFVDKRTPSGYKFLLIGPDPTDATTVLVRAVPPKTSAQKPMILKIATVQDPSKHALRLQVVQSYQHTAPEEFKTMHDHAQKISSQSNLKRLTFAIQQYIEDHDEHLPDADKWVDELMPYVKTESVFRDPSAPAGEKWSYAYNHNLSGVSIAELATPADTVMLFESTTGTKNASDLGESVPHPGRHSGGTDYGFADGRVQWYADGTTLSYALSGK